MQAQVWIFVQHVENSTLQTQWESDSTSRKDFILILLFRIGPTPFSLNSSHHKIVIKLNENFLKPKMLQIHR